MAQWGLSNYTMSRGSREAARLAPNLSKNKRVERGLCCGICRDITSIRYHIYINHVFRCNPYGPLLYRLPVLGSLVLGSLPAFERLTSTCSATILARCRRTVVLLTSGLPFGLKISGFRYGMINIGKRLRLDIIHNASHRMKGSKPTSPVFFMDRHRFLHNVVYYDTVVGVLVFISKIPHYALLFPPNRYTCTDFIKLLS